MQPTSEVRGGAGVPPRVSRCLRAAYERSSPALLHPCSRDALDRTGLASGDRPSTPWHFPVHSRSPSERTPAQLAPPCDPHSHHPCVTLRSNNLGDGEVGGRLVRSDSLCRAMACWNSPMSSVRAVPDRHDVACTCGVELPQWPCEQRQRNSRCSRLNWDTTPGHVHESHTCMSHTGGRGRLSRSVASVCSKASFSCPRVGRTDTAPHSLHTPQRPHNGRHSRRITPPLPRPNTVRQPANSHAHP